MRPRANSGRTLFAAWLLLASCTGHVPGTGTPSEARPGVVYQTVRVGPTPAPEAPAAPPAVAAPAFPEVPSYPSAPATTYAAAPAPAPQTGPAPAPAASFVPGSGPRDQQIAILTEAVTALREEIARSYTHSQELLEETKRLRAQLRSMRSELEKTRGENEKLRAHVRTLEKRLQEIRVTPPVAGQPAPPPAEAPAAPVAEAAPEPAPEDEIPEPPIVDDRAPAEAQDETGDQGN